MRRPSIRSQVPPSTNSSHCFRMASARLETCLFSEHFWASRVTKPPSDQGPCFEHANLRGCLFDRVWINGANFRNADLTDTAFHGCHLDGAILRNTRACNTLLVACN